MASICGAGLAATLLGGAATIGASDAVGVQKKSVAQRRSVEEEKTAAEELDLLIDDLRDPSPDVRQSAACAIAERGREGERAVEALILALELDVRSTAPGSSRGGVSCYRPSARDLARWKSFEAMVAFMRRVYAYGEESRRRLPVPWALRRTHGAERGAIAVVDLLRREPGLRFVPADAADLLGALGPGAVPALSRAAVAEPNAQIRWIAVMALGKVDPTTKATRAALERVVAEQSGDVQKEAAHVLEGLEAPRR